MKRLFKWKANHFYTWKYTFVKSTPPELSNDRLLDAESELCQKLLAIDGFPGAL